MSKKSRKPSVMAQMPVAPPMSTQPPPGVGDMMAPPVGPPAMAPGPKANPDNMLPPSAFHTTKR